MARKNNPTHEVSGAASGARAPVCPNSFERGHMPRSNHPLQSIPLRPPSPSPPPSPASTSGNPFQSRFLPAVLSTSLVGRPRNPSPPPREAARTPPRGVLRNTDVGPIAQAAHAGASPQHARREVQSAPPLSLDVGPNSLSDQTAICTNGALPPEQGGAGVPPPSVSEVPQVRSVASVLSSAVFGRRSRSPSPTREGRTGAAAPLLSAASAMSHIHI